MTKRKKRVPELRFKGFTDDWEQRKYGEVIDLLSGQDFSPSEYNDTGDGTPYMTGASCIVGKETIVNRWTTVPRCLAERGDVLLVCKGSGYGAIAVMVQDKAHIARQFMALKNLPNLDKVFNFYLLNSVIDNIKKDARGLIAGIARDTVIKQEISIPLFAEQSQIGSLLKTLDDIIALHQRKLEQLMLLKKGFLQITLPKLSNVVPKLRFTNFDGKWEQRKLGESADIIGGGTPSTDNKEYWGGDIDWYSPAEIGGQTFVNCSQKKITKLGLQKSSSKILPIGTVLFTSRASIGNTAILANKGATNQGFQSIVPHKDKLDSYFIYSRTHELKRYGETNGAGSTFMEVSGKQMAKMPILIPTIEEQKKIGGFFERLDHLITFHQNKINRLQTLKKAYLKKMFI